MPFVSASLKDAVEPQIQPEGLYDLVIHRAEPYHNDSSGKDSIEMDIKFIGTPNAQNIRHYMALPHESDDGEKRNNKLVGINRFLDRFSIPHEGSGFATEDMVGATGKFFVTLEEGQDGVTRNKLTMKKV